MSRRLDKLNQAILESASSTILFSLRDPRIEHVTVTRVETAPDTRTAKVYVSVMGDETKQRLCLHGLESARGFIQKRVADRIQTRFTPVLEFVIDDGVKKSIEASRIIQESLEDGIPLPGDPLPGNIPFGAGIPAAAADATSGESNVEPAASAGDSEQETTPTGTGSAPAADD